MFVIRVKQRWAGHDACMRKTRDSLKVWFRHLYSRDCSRETGVYVYENITTKLSMHTRYVKKYYIDTSGEDRGGAVG